MDEGSLLVFILYLQLLERGKNENWGVEFVWVTPGASPSSPFFPTSPPSPHFPNFPHFLKHANYQLLFTRATTSFQAQLLAQPLKDPFILLEFETVFLCIM